MTDELRVGEAAAGGRPKVEAQGIELSMNDAHSSGDLRVFDAARASVVSEKPQNATKMLEPEAGSMARRERIASTLLRELQDAHAVGDVVLARTLARQLAELLGT